MQINTQFKTTKLAFVTLLIMAVITVIAGCGSSSGNSIAKTANTSEAKTAAEEQGYVIKHEMGETALKQVPKKIVVLELSFLDALLTLNVTPVGITDDGSNKDVVNIAGKELEYTSVGTRSQPNLEAISMLQPDLIIADLSRHKTIYKELEGIAPTIVLKSLNASYQEILNSFSQIGEAAGKGDEAEKLLAEHHAVIEDLKKQVPADENRKVLLATFREDGVFVHGSESFYGELHQILGIKNAMQSETARENISLEQFVKLNPDVLYVTIVDDKILKEWSSNPLWQSVSAVKNDQIFDEIDRYVWTRYRGLKAAETIASDAIRLLYVK
ncbi:hypothetical protein BBD42_15030 [Paenibacillus sp. BIHB 4019]|uniref:Fe/B12 periplasmic-binding domain-containing protein n=1 Tax=Paenibacillus sp. BIHB 4019 TaxID=1870819 RepID=A0A1B2DIX2_9BACL|nr:Fe(3+) dicitrate ABC transporter substrate-binding protein [Paenibacillus sp. BIHB 4019]ANY67646.1 hypothetical protein BBD42_15030 [Paenibacillus sp. BIHB 4019]